MPDKTVPRLLAGAPWRDRHRAPRPADAPRWFEPLHVREPGRVREALTAQVEAGADIIVAPAWLTHRRVLMEIGESRRAAEWTLAAVRVAREAVEEGLPRRRAARSEDPILVAGPLPDLDAQPEAGSGRLAARGVAADRDREAQAGILADAGVDLILVEAHSTMASGAGAVAAAAATGLAAWATLRADTGTGAGAGEQDAWVESLAMAGASTILIEASELSPSSSGVATGVDGVAGLVERSIRLEGRSIGVLLERGLAERPGEQLRRWLERGAAVLGVGEGATPAALGPLREAIDAQVIARRTAREESHAPWRAWVAQGAERAPTGAALWLEDGSRPPDAGTDRPESLPDGFAWTRADASELRRLPAQCFRFVVADADVDLAELVRLLDEGGIAVARLATEDLPRLEGAQLIELRPHSAGTLITLRRGS